MKILSFILTLLAFAIFANAQTPSAQAILAKSIQYHDPQGTWGKEKLDLNVEESRPNGAPRLVKITIDLPESYFKMTQTRDSNRIERVVIGEECTFQLNGKSEFSAEAIKQFGLTCERSIATRNYYTYLWGLPMKLKDPGMILNDTVALVDFFGKQAHQIKVTYDKKVGSDVWFFYFEPATAALIGYKFYHDEAKKDGEYITLEGEELVNGLRLPKIRKWYWNQDNKFIGTDTLTRGK